jgi:hypothetical protein
MISEINLIGMPVKCSSDYLVPKIVLPPGDPYRAQADATRWNFIQSVRLGIGRQQMPQAMR